MNLLSCRGLWNQERYGTRGTNTCINIECTKRYTYRYIVIQEKVMSKNRTYNRINKTTVYRIRIGLELRKTDSIEDIWNKYTQCSQSVRVKIGHEFKELIIIESFPMFCVSLTLSIVTLTYANVKQVLKKPPNFNDFKNCTKYWFHMHYILINVTKALEWVFIIWCKIICILILYLYNPWLIIC